jgi:hypothetical protein
MVVRLEEKSCEVLPQSLLSLRSLPFRVFTNFDRRAGCFRCVTAVTVSGGSLVLVASLEVRADGLFVRAEVGEARTEVGCERETSMAHTFRDWRDTSWQQTAPGRSWFAHDQ